MTMPVTLITAYPSGLISTNLETGILHPFVETTRELSRRLTATKVQRLCRCRGVIFNVDETSNLIPRANTPPVNWVMQNSCWRRSPRRYSLLAGPEDGGIPEILQGIAPSRPGKKEEEDGGGEEL